MQLGNLLTIHKSYSRQKSHSVDNYLTFGQGLLPKLRYCDQAKADVVDNATYNYAVEQGLQGWEESCGIRLHKLGKDKDHE